MHRTLSLLLVLVLAGCSFTPDYQRPAAPVPAHMAGSRESRRPTGFPSVTGETALAADWRSYFPDSRLQVLIAAALEHNRDLRIAVARVDEARALAGIARADRFPTLDLGAQRSASLTPADLSGTGRQLNSQRYDAESWRCRLRAGFLGESAGPR